MPNVKKQDAILNIRPYQRPSRLTVPQHLSLRTWLSKMLSSSSHSSNTPSIKLPFQRWFKFKEAFSPQLVVEFVRQQRIGVATCLDAFGGCGTTGLTSQFLGIKPVLIEVNPFLADLAEAKLTKYDLDRLRVDYLTVRRQVNAVEPDVKLLLEEAPATFVEPGIGGRWVYPADILRRILAYRLMIEGLTNESNRRLLRVLLGSILVPISNVVVNGKGRKYRKNWELRQKDGKSVDDAFHEAFLDAIGDLTAYQSRPTQDYKVLRGNAIELVKTVEPCDLAIFSPPYPNSFDYTDVYNLELWTLGYLRSRAENTALRKATLRSHVQVRIAYGFTATKSPILDRTLKLLRSKRYDLWDPQIPEMIGAYFDDLAKLLANMRNAIRASGEVYIVVGDSSYSGVKIRVGDILAEIAVSEGYGVIELQRLRQMRLSAQQGGSTKLGEILLRLRRLP
jgi:DNA modification methylase